MNSVSVGELFVRLIVALGVVVGLMAAAAWVLRRVSGGRIAGPRSARPVPVEILARHTLGRRASVAVVRAGNRGLLLGVTDQSVTLLAETSADELVLPEPPRTVASTGQEPTGSPWRMLAEQLRDRTVRRS